MRPQYFERDSREREREDLKVKSEREESDILRVGTSANEMPSTVYRATKTLLQIALLKTLFEIALSIKRYFK